MRSTLVGAGGGEGAMDAANILKPALARGELRAIGATTLDEYQSISKRRTRKTFPENNYRRTRYRKCISIRGIKRNMKHTTKYK
jgi:ATP-dependent Clp protease ATP-binding subunit ClpB